MPKLHVNFILAAVVAFSTATYLGCNTSTPPKPATDEHDHHDHGHADEGPHHGDLIELGDEEFHAELVHDEATHKVAIYLLDGHAEKPVSIAADAPLTLNLVVGGKPQQHQLPAAPQEGDPAGQTSRFEAVNQPLCDAICGKEECQLRMNVTIGGKAYTGELAHKDHDHEHKK